MIETKVTTKNLGYEMIIHIREAGLPVVEEFNNGIKLSEGSYTHETVAKAILHSIETPQIITPIMPKGTLFFTQTKSKKTFCFMEVEPHNREVHYHSSTIKNVPYPRLVFGFELTKSDEQYFISEVILGALESQVVSYEEAMLYYYPYTNVYETFNICWGTVQLPRLDRISQLSTIPELFFSAPNSDSLYGSDTNKSKMSFRELAESLKKKDFPDEYLNPTGKTLKQWMMEQANCS